MLTSQLIRELAPHHRITVAVLSDNYADDGPFADELAREYPGSLVFAAKPVTSGEEPYRVRAHKSSEFTQHVAAEISGGAYDVIHCESYFLMQHIREDCAVPIVLLEENVEWQLDQTLKNHAPEYAQEDWIRNRNVILATWKRAKRLVFLTDFDRDAAFHARETPPSSMLRFGWDHLPSSVRAESTGELHRCVLVGNFGWQPTRDAADFLINDIWPVVRRQCALPLYLVGAGMAPRDVKRWSAGDGVEVVGQVESVSPWLHCSTILLAPQRASSGSSVKVIEAMRRGAQVVSTQRIADALPTPWNTHVWIANEPADYAAAVVGALDHPKRIPSTWPMPTWRQAATVLEDAWLHATGRPVVRREVASE